MNDERYTKDFKFVRTGNISTPSIAELAAESADRCSRVLNAYQKFAGGLDDDKNLTPEGTRAAKVELATTVFKGTIAEENEKIAKLERVAERSRGEIFSMATGGLDPREAEHRREIRDRLSGMDPVEIEAKLQVAALDGDELFVAACFEAPKSFRVVSEDALTEAVQICGGVRNPDAAALLADQESGLEMLRYNVAVVRRNLEKSLNIATRSLDGVGTENPHASIYEICFNRPVPSINGARAGDPLAAAAAGSGQ